MKSKFILSTLALILFALLGGGSIDPDAIGFFIVYLFVVVAVVAIIAGITSMVKSNNMNKRLQMIKEDEKNSPDFDRSVSIGDDRCKIYFDSEKKQVMVMRVMTEGIKKVYIDDFEFPGNELAKYSGSSFYIYDPIKRRLLSGSYNDLNITHQISSISENDKNKDVAINNSIQPCFKNIFGVEASYHILIEENRGLIAICESGKVLKVFNYVNAASLPLKIGEESTVNTKTVGDYMFIMDDFFKVLVLINRDTHEVFNYADIIEVSYEENGNQLYTKSAGRTVGGAIVGGVLMGGAGAVVGGLSGASKQNKEVKSIDVKILLRSTSRTSHTLHFNAANRVLKTKEDADRKLYEQYTKNANKAKDLLSVIIDDAKQAAAQVAPVMSQPIAPQSTSVADELSKLAKLKADGILTEEEFLAQKAKLLG
ncbi:MAG: SHOCT domain-containing protein [Bacteroidaceae bacterium]|nr:SHOCT domain-containing protein [Bacteroidaceae bacterium]